MIQNQLMLQAAFSNENIKNDLILYNSKTEAFGLALTEEEVVSLTEQRFEVLQETRRVEFGRGPLLELVSTFGRSTHVNQETYVEVLAALQELFYRLKEETKEEVSDNDLIDALYYFFEEEAQGSIEACDGLSSEQIGRILARTRHDIDEDWSENDSYEQAKEGNEPETSRDEIDRITQGGEHYRPDNDYADNFYNAYDELYQAGFDGNSRIGGSSL